MSISESSCEDEELSMSPKGGPKSECSIGNYSATLKTGQALTYLYLFPVSKDRCYCLVAKI